MGKNRKRDRKNKKSNEQTFDVEVKVSSAVNINCTVKYPEVDETQNCLNSLTITNSSLQNANSSKNGKETLNELKKEANKQIFSGVKIEKINPNSAIKARSSFEVNYKMEKKPFVENKANEMQYVTISDNEKKVQPWTETYSKAKIPIKNNQVEETEALVTTTSTSRGIGHEVPETIKVIGSNPERRGNSESASKMTGAKPKATSQLRNPMAKDNRKIKQDEKYSRLFDLFNKSIRQQVNKYESNWKKLAILYPTWKNRRQNTIAKLQELVEKVHEDQRGFNQTNVFFKDLNVGSREIKDSNSSPTFDFFTSLAAFVTDAASGITSAVQAANVDVHTTAFKEIMEDDGEITKPLHAARSQCLEEYSNVEEIVRQCHLKTFGDTVEGISNMLKVEDLLSDIKNIRGEDSVGQVIDDVALFLKRNSNLEVLGEVYNSFNEYLDSNPAAYEACKSAGKAMYGMYDTWGRNHNQGRLSIQGNMSMISNKMMLMEQRRELSELRSIASNDDKNQAKLESEIHGAISSLQNELREISNIFEKINQGHHGKPWYF